MGDEDYGDPLGRHVPDGLQQCLGLFLRQDRGGLVQDQQLQVLLTQLPGDLRKLLVAHRHIADDHVSADLDAHFVNGLGGALLDLLIIQRIQPGAEGLGDDALFRGFPVEQDVFGGGKAGDQGKFLVDHADAGGQCVKRVGELDLLPIDQNLSLIPAGLSDHIHAKEDLHQRALTGAVFSHKAQDLTCLQREVDVRQDLIAEEVLFDISHLQQRSVVVFHSISLPFSFSENSRESSSPCCFE